LLKFIVLMVHLLAALRVFVYAGIALQPARHDFIAGASVGSALTYQE